MRPKADITTEPGILWCPAFLFLWLCDFPNFFLIGLSLVDVDMQRNVQLLKERSWFDIQVVYGDGTRAILAVEKAPLGARALAMLESAAERLRVASLPLAPAAPDRTPLDAVLKYAALSSTQSGNPVRTTES